MINQELNILLVEDEPAIRVFMKISLMNSDLPVGHVFEADDGKEALDIMDNVQINVILTDINMPVMDGFEFIDRVHNHPVFKEIPVIAVTSVNSEKLTNMLSFLGHGYIEKPFDMGDLTKEIMNQYSNKNEYILYG